MIDSQPRIAVLMSVYNGEKYLSQQINSIYSQKVKNISLFMRDDCSQDSTVEIIMSYKEKYDINLIEGKERLGSAQSFLTLLSIVPDCYSIYFFSDQDDWWEPCKISRVISFFNSDYNDPVLYCSKFEIVDDEMNHLGFSKKPVFLNFNNALVESSVLGCTIAFNLSAKKIVNTCIPKFVIMHDWWIYLVISAFGTIVYDDHPVIKYRQHKDNVIGYPKTFLSLYINRFLRLFQKKRTGSFKISNQLSIFLDCYCEILDAEKLYSLNLFVEGKNSIIKRIQICFSRIRKRQKFLDDILLRFMILFNLY